MDNNGRGQVLYPSRIDIPATVRSELVAILNHTLAHTLDLKTQVKQAHWNVKGMEFYTLHELFDEMATELEEFVDSFAERVTALGGTAMGTARMVIDVSTLPDYPIDLLDGVDHVIALADRYATLAELVRNGIAKTDELGDADSADLYTEVSRNLDKRLWFLDAHLQTPSLVLKVASPESTATPAIVDMAAQSTASITSEKSAVNSISRAKSSTRSPAKATTKTTTTNTATTNKTRKSGSAAKSVSTAKSTATSKSASTKLSASATNKSSAKSASTSKTPSTTVADSATPTSGTASKVKSTAPKLGSRAKSSQTKKSQ